jgi:hypothetical protein
VEEAILHQVALLDGYRKSVSEGSKILIKEFDPSSIKKELIQSKIQLGPIAIPYKYISFLVNWKILRILQAKHSEYSLESVGVIEKKIFRPPFIRNYLESLNSGQEKMAKSGP